MKIGIDLDDVMAVCAVPYLRKFAEEYRVELPDEREIGWHLLRDMDPYVAPEERDRFRIKLYDGTFFSELEVYEDCPAVLERLVAGFVTETWLREKGILDYAKAVHLKPTGEFNPSYPRGRYDPTGSAEYKARLAKELALDAFCEDDIVISKTLSDAGVRVFLFDQPWNREVKGARITRVSGWSDLAQHLGV